jgi:molecular chaperone DnaJ
MQSNVTCGECAGRGTKPSETCSTCKGTGIERKTSDITINIPAGISSGEALRLNGQGEYPGAGGVAGDLYIRVHVKSHPVFSREGDDIHSTVHVPYSLLLLGGSWEIETIDGKGSLKIPEGTEAGTVFRIRSKGAPRVNGSHRGDHICTVIPLAPRKLSREQRKSLEALREAGL